MHALTSIVQQIFADFGRGNIPAIVERFAEDIRFVHSGGPDVPYARDRHGKKAAAAFFDDLASFVDVTSFEPKQCIERGDDVVALGAWVGRAKITGRSFESEWAMLWRFDGDRVKFFQAYENTNAVANAFTDASGR